MVLERLFADFRRGFAAVLGLATLGLVSVPAQAQVERGWSLCNETSYIVEAAVGKPEGRSVVVEGWTKIKPGDCRIVLPAPLETGVHFLYARSSLAHRGGLRSWGGDQPLCVDVTGSFSVESPPDCAAMGLEEKEFRPVVVERRNGWQTTLQETNPYTLERARAAGVQRLLDDAGVLSDQIDGFIGRKTRAAIADFLKDNKLPTQMSDEDLIDILEQAAIARARSVGLTLCNRTTKRIWAAIARQRTDGWESRGWWQLEAGGCARAIDEELLLVPHFVYGEIEEAGGVRRPKSGRDGFCVGRAKFAITGRTECEASAYRPAMFVSTAVPQDGKLVYEFFERDFGPLEAVE